MEISNKPLKSGWTATGTACVVSCPLGAIEGLERLEAAKGSTKGGDSRAAIELAGLDAGAEIAAVPRLVALVWLLVKLFPD